MTPAVRSLVAAVIAVLAVGAPLAGSPARAADVALTGTDGVRATGERAIFTGVLVRLRSEVADGQLVRVYQVSVDEVYGDVDVPTRRVSVQAAVDLEACGAGVGQGQAGPTGTAGTGGSAPGGAQQEQATPGSSPSTSGSTPSPTTTPPTTAPTPSGVDDRRLRAFDTVVDGNRYVVAGCGRVQLVDEQVRAVLADTYGGGRPPGTDETPAGPDVAEVGYLCPGTGDAVDPDDERSCSALDDRQSFDRAAAPGLALVIVGILGLLLARRMGRRRTR